MQAVKSSGSKIERLLGKALWKRGLRYRKNYSRVFGRPDFALMSLKIAIFSDSEFWHGKNWKKRKLEHKTNMEFWHKKILGNIKRDRLVNRTLKRNGWVVLRFWGKQIEEDVESCADLVMDAVMERKRHIRNTASN